MLVIVDSTRFAYWISHLDPNSWYHVPVITGSKTEYYKCAKTDAVIGSVTYNDNNSVTCKRDVEFK